MKKNLFIPFFLLLLVSSMAMAQKAPIRWGKLLPTDAGMTVYSKDPKAGAVVLCDYGTADVGPRTEYTRHVRIKILNEDGLKYANVEIPYKEYDRYDVFSQLKAQTINVENNGRRIKTKVRGRDIEDVQVDRFNKKKVFRFPDVKVGSIIEYEYTIHSLDLVKLHDWYFQSTIPVMWSEYRVYINRRFDYLVTFQKGRDLDLDEQKAFADRLQWLYDTRTNKARRELMKKKYVLYESPKGTVKVYYAQGESYTFVMNDMPAFDPKQGVVALTDYYPVVKVHMYLAEGNFPFFYRRILATAQEDFDWTNPHASYYNFFRGYISYWLPTWDEATKKWLNSDLFGNRLKKSIDNKEVSGKTVEPGSDGLTTAKNIYQYVKDNVQWDGTYSMYAYRDLNKVLHKKTGSSGEINLLLISLLQHAGLEVNPVLIRTRDMGRIENIYPEFNQFNHVIAQVEVNGRTLYLDASGKTSSFTSLPWNVDKTEGFVVSKDKYKWVDVMAAPQKQKLVVPAVYKEL
jgi:hypothetical protein